MYTEAALERARRLGLKLGRPNLEEFAAILTELAVKDSNILVVTSDSRGSGKLVGFGQRLPRQIVEVGIAEQNLVGIAAGLAATGKKVFAVSPACFLTARALEQIKTDVAYSDHPVVLVGISAGVSYGALGSTHHSLHDLAALRAIHNVSIVVPGDNVETRAAVAAAAQAQHPIYLRLGKAPLYDVNGQPCSDVRAAVIVKEGTDLAFIATGETVIHALLAADELEDRDGVSCRVVSVPTVRPLDCARMLAAAHECKAVLTVEEHSVCGGLGEACAALFMEAGARTAFKRIAIPDEYTATGSQADIFRHYGITMEGLARSARTLLGASR
jgi:transketolase